MTQFILRRVLQALPLLLLISIGVFSLIHFVPGGPLTVYLSNPQVRPEDIERLQRSLGLDRPVTEQYLRWLLNFIRGDWVRPEAVTSLRWERTTSARTRFW